MFKEVFYDFRVLRQLGEGSIEACLADGSGILTRSDHERGCVLGFGRKGG